MTTLPTLESSLEPRKVSSSSPLMVLISFSLSCCRAISALAQRVLLKWRSDEVSRAGFVPKTGGYMHIGEYPIWIHFKCPSNHGENDDTVMEWKWMEWNILLLSSDELMRLPSFTKWNAPVISTDVQGPAADKCRKHVTIVPPGPCNRKRCKPPHGV